MLPRPRRSAFTLLEALMVVILIGIVAAVVMPRILLSREKARENLCFQQKREINFGIERYFQEEGTLPTDLSELSDYFPEGIPNCPVASAGYTLNTSNTRIDGHTPGDH